jgi:hypothetical protein
LGTLQVEWIVQVRHADLSLGVPSEELSWVLKCTILLLTSHEQVMLAPASQTRIRSDGFGCSQLAEHVEQQIKTGAWPLVPASWCWLVRVLLHACTCICKHEHEHSALCSIPATACLLHSGSFCCIPRCRVVRDIHTGVIFFSCFRSTKAAATGS